MEYEHVPVMLEEVLEFLRLKKGDTVVDGTLGGAGYSRAILNEIGESGQLYSFDADEAAIENAEKIKKQNKNKNWNLIHDNFREFKIRLAEFGIDSKHPYLSAVVFDLGLSSYQLSDKTRGFSFAHDAPLDMAFGQKTDNRKQTTENIVNKFRESELERILKDYGEERYAKLIARGIVKERREKSIETTKDLVEIIKKYIPNSYINNKIHFATKTFQALRIATNDELGSLRIALKDSLDLLKPGARMVVVSFHSLEDKIVKEFFKQEARDCLCPPEIPLCNCGHSKQIKIITKKPLGPSQTEIKNNPRSRSAKLRVGEKI
jgi:16S rRNA (cytosine1402-N4)-methyltransferase